jgi:hypothetical protein
MLDESLKVKHLPYLTNKDLEVLFLIKGHRITMEIKRRKYKIIE